MYEYSFYFEQALKKIRAFRNPKSSKPEIADFDWNVIQNQAMFKFDNKNFLEQKNIIQASKDISISCLKTIIMLSDRENENRLKAIEMPEDKFCFNALFALEDVKNETKLIFKEIESGPFYFVGRDYDEMKDESIRFIYLVFDHASMQVIGHNSDDKDPGKGHSIYSFRWFWNEYLRPEEYQAFMDAYNKYISGVEDYIGFINVKTLTPNAGINFRRIVENHVVSTSYSYIKDRQLTGKENKAIKLSDDGYKKILKSYFDNEMYKILLGKMEYAESLITAEWLYMTMKEAKAIDLTVIATGYFKTVEQLLATIICLPSNANKDISLNKNYKKKVKDVDKNKDLSLGTMSTFFKEHLEVFKNDIGDDNKEFVKEIIYSYTVLRNGYLHKHNIHSWEKIDNIRDETFFLLLVVLGAYSFLDSERSTIGLNTNNKVDSFYKLCEFINYHCGEVFYIKLSDGSERICIGLPDMEMKIDEDGCILYSGIYLRDLGTGTAVKISREKVPAVITYGRFVFERSNEVKSQPQKKMIIYNNGKFVGPDIVEENDLNY